MGDNRDRSYDSRFWGFVKTDKIKGLAFIKYWSWDKEHFERAVEEHRQADRLRRLNYKTKDPFTADKGEWVFFVFTDDRSSSTLCRGGLPMG